MRPETDATRPRILMRRNALMAAAVMFAGTSLASGDAPAVGLRVKLACKNDYYTFCNGLGADSPETRQCMRVAGPKLSKRCIDALLAAGEVTPDEVAQRTPK